MRVKGERIAPRGTEHRRHTAEVRHEQPRRLSNDEFASVNLVKVERAKIEPKVPVEKLEAKIWAKTDATLASIAKRAAPSIAARLEKLHAAAAAGAASLGSGHLEPSALKEGAGW